MDEWTFECPMDISVRPMDEWTFECPMDISVRPMDEWTFLFAQWTFLLVQWTNRYLFMFNGHVTFTMPRKL